MGARKVDEFGDINLSHTKARLDALAIELQNDPATTGFIIKYRTGFELPGQTFRWLNWIKKYMTTSRGLNPKRIAIIDGGQTSCSITEFWVAPVRTTPEIRPDAYPTTFVDIESARKFDEYYYPLFDDYYEILGDSLEAYTAAVKKEPNAQAYVIIYPQYYVERFEEGRNGKIITRRRINHDTSNAIAIMMREIKNALVKKHKLSAPKIKIVNGGYRKLRQVELWILPRSEHAPIATPNSFPPKRRE